MHGKRGISSLCALLWLLATGMAQAQTPGASVLVLHNSFVSSEKFQLLQPLAAQRDVALQHLNVENADSEALQQALENSALVVLDVPRPSDRAQVSRALDARQDLPPQLTIGGGALCRRRRVQLHPLLCPGCRHSTRRAGHA